VLKTLTESSSSDTEGSRAIVDVDFRDHDNRTALHIAAAYNHIDIVELLLKVGADTTIVDRWDGLPIDETINEDIKELLRQYGSPAPDETTGVYRFLRAANVGDLDLVRTMAEHGMRLDVHDYDKRTALHLAICSHHYEVVKYLVTQNRELTELRDRWQNTPIDNAKQFCASSSLKAARLIWRLFHSVYLEGNRKPLSASTSNLLSLNTHTPKAGAHRHSLRRIHSQKALTTPLLSEGVSEEKATTPSGDHRFYDAEIFSIVTNGDLAALKLLVKRGQILNNVRDYDDRNLLHVACCFSNLTIVRYLVEHDVNLNQRDSKDHTPLYEAMQTGDGAIVQFLKDNGAILISGILGAKLCKAAADGNLEKLKSYVQDSKFIGKVNTADYDHRTALHLACCNGHLSVVKWLVQNGADANIMDRFGNDPAEDAKRYGHEEIAECLSTLFDGDKLQLDITYSQ